MSVWDVLKEPISGIINSIGRVVDDVVTTEEERLEIKKKLAELEVSTLEHASELFKAQRDVIVAEAQGESWLQRSWRPLTMLVFVFVIFNNFVLVPYGSAFGLEIPALEIPNGMWALLNVGIGGYIASRGVEKVVRERNSS